MKEIGRRSNSPEISEGPHSEMFDWRVLLLFRKFTILSRPPWSSRATRSLGLVARRGRVSNHFVAVHLFLVSLGAGCTRPPVTTRGLGGQGRLDAPHMEKVLAPIAFHGILSVREGSVWGPEESENGKERLTARTTSGKYRKGGYSLSNRGQFPSPPQYTRISTPKFRIRSPGLRNRAVDRLSSNATKPITYGS